MRGLKEILKAERIGRIALLVGVVVGAGVTVFCLIGM